MGFPLTRSLAVLLVIGFALPLACDGDPEEETPPVDGPHLYLPEDDSRVESIVVEDDELELTFNVAAPEIGLHMGQVVAGRQDGGYLREITAISPFENGATLDTKSASVVDALDSASLHETLVLDGAWEMVSDDRSEASRGDLVLDGLVIFDGYSNVAELQVLVVEGSLSYTPELTLDAVVAEGQLQSFEATVAGLLDLDATFEVSLVAPFSYTTEQVLATYSVPLSLAIGEVPLEGVATVNLVGGIEVIAIDGGTVQATAHLTADGTTGARLDEGVWTEAWEMESQASSDVDPDWIADTNLYTRVWLRPEVSVSFLGRDATTVGVEGSVAADLTGFAPMEWTIHAATDAGGEVTADPFDGSIDELDLAGAEEPILVAQSDGSLEGYSALAGGDEFTCGLELEGGIVCWGDDSFGQLAAPAGAYTQVTAGAQHACGLTDAGEIACWGSESAVLDTPTDGVFTHLGAGTEFTCAVRDDGSLRCWGVNDEGQADAPAEGAFSRVTAGSYHACAVDDGLEVQCWGLDEAGQGTPLEGPFIEITAGRRYTCGLSPMGSLGCWGCQVDDQGQCEPPVGQYLQVDAGRNHACAVREDGRVMCWGSAAGGQTNPPPSDTFSQVTGGAHHSCGVKTSAAAECWGNDDSGQSTPP